MDNLDSQLSERRLAERFAIREATPADAGAISALLEQAFRDFKALYTPEAFFATVLSESDVLVRLGEGPVWVAETDSTLIGTVGALCVSDSVMVRGMAVSPTARGFGLGGKLLGLTEEFARKRGYQRLSLYTTAFLKQAIRLYEGAGFQFTGETYNPHGTELLRMVKALADYGR
jgi:putative acetyltransferase